jgi:hypothetical protein
MRSNQSSPGFDGQRVSRPFGVAGLPLEWLDAGSWRLPSGKALAEFALQAGFLAPLLFRPETSKKNDGMLSGPAPLRQKPLRKGAPR